MGTSDSHAGKVILDRTAVQKEGFQGGWQIGGRAGLVQGRSDGTRTWRLGGGVLVGTTWVLKGPSTWSSRAHGGGSRRLSRREPLVITQEPPKGSAHDLSCTAGPTQGARCQLLRVPTPTSLISVFLRNNKKCTRDLRTMLLITIFIIAQSPK